MKSKESLEKFVSYDDLAKFDENSKLLVNRISINLKYSKSQDEYFNFDKFKKISDIHKRLREADLKNKAYPIWGLELTVKEIKEIFTKEDVSPTTFRLPYSHKGKDPMELNTGEELYEYLKGKSEKEIEDYFVSRGAVIRNGIMFNNGLYTLYRIYKESIESQNVDNEVSNFDGEDDGLER